MLTSFEVGHDGNVGLAGPLVRRCLSVVRPLGLHSIVDCQWAIHPAIDRRCIAAASSVERRFGVMAPLQETQKQLQLRRRLSSDAQQRQLQYFCPLGQLVATQRKTRTELSTKSRFTEDWSDGGKIRQWDHVRIALYH